MGATGLASVTMALVLWCDAATAAGAVPPVRGTVVMARGGTTVTYLWNATPYVTNLVAAHNVGQDGLHAMEATALVVLRERARSGTSPSMAITVLYERTGAVSPAYGTATFEGVERVFTLTAKRREILKNADVWTRNLADGVVPKGLSALVTGELPPAS